MRYKRPYDLAFVFAVGVTLFAVWIPAWIAVILAVYFTMGRPIFYTQDRVGRDGRVFRIIKFRTMVRDAERSSGPVLAEVDDTRITSLGKILRKSSLDEAPQVWNIIKGEMSLVGPRPERPELIFALKQELPDFNDRHAVRPGIVHLAYVRLPKRSYRLSARHRLRYDLFYIKHTGPGLDTSMIWRAANNAFRLLTNQ